MTRENSRLTPGLIVLFGSGEMTSVGRKVREDVWNRAGLTAPVRVGILETPTGFEANAIHGWPERQQHFIETHLKNFDPVVQRIRAWSKSDRSHGTNDPAIVDVILDMDYVYCGAGSPTYVVRNLRGTRAWRNMRAAHANGTVLCLGSATAMAAGSYVLPVYEIFKAGHDLSWIRGLDLFRAYGLSLAVIPHWDNQEGEDFDSTRCWMGQERFMKLRDLLPAGVSVLGIDETTALVFDMSRGLVTVLGTGNAHVLSGGRTILLTNGETYPVALLRT